MNKKNWLIAPVALALGAGVALAMTQGAQQDGPVAATPTETAETGAKEGGDSKDQSKDFKDDKGTEAADDEQAAEQQVQQTVNTYAEAEAGDTKAV